MVFKNIIVLSYLTAFAKAAPALNFAIFSAAIFNLNIIITYPEALSEKVVNRSNIARMNREFMAAKLCYENEVKRVVGGA